MRFQQARSHRYDRVLQVTRGQPHRFMEQRKLAQNHHQTFLEHSYPAGPTKVPTRRDTSLHLSGKSYMT